MYLSKHPIFSLLAPLINLIPKHIHFVAYLPVGRWQRNFLIFLIFLFWKSYRGEVVSEQSVVMILSNNGKTRWHSSRIRICNIGHTIFLSKHFNLATHFNSLFQIVQWASVGHFATPRQSNVPQLSPLLTNSIHLYPIRVTIVNPIYSLNTKSTIVTYQQTKSTTEKILNYSFRMHPHFSWRNPTFQYVGHSTSTFYMFRTQCCSELE